MKSKLIILIIFVMSLFVLIPSEVKAYNDTKNENIVTVASIVESSSSGVPDYVGNGKDICDTTLTDFYKKLLEDNNDICTSISNLNDLCRLF